MSKVLTVVLDTEKVELSPEKVLLIIGGLKETKIRAGSIAKALSNENIITKEMVMPFLTELEKRQLITQRIGSKKFENAVPVPIYELTSKGYIEIKALQS